MAPPPRSRDMSASPCDGSAHFHTTHWSIVAAAGAQRDSPQAREALSTLCQHYWRPLYAWLRRQGHSTHDAQDLTQGFFARMFDKHDLADVNRRLGRFRSFLLASLRHYASNERDKAQARKRGGGRCHLALDFDDAESRFAAEPAAPGLSPERIFEREWALALLSRVLDRLREELVAKGKEAWFAAFKPLLVAEADAPSYADVAAKLGTSQGTVKVTVHRLRRRYRTLLQEEVAQTVADPGQVDEELRELIGALRGE